MAKTRARRVSATASEASAAAAMVSAHEHPHHTIGAGASLLSSATGKQGAEARHFPFKLYDMLEYASSSEYASAVAWVEDGCAFVILDKDEFMEKVVPLFFNQTKFRSFVSP
jgi:hypothetical protein